MEYYRAEFNIDCSEELRQTARDLLADAAGAAGFEAFDDTPTGLFGYVQREVFDKSSLDEAITLLPLRDAKVSYVLSSVLDEDWNKEWERHGFEPIDIDGKLLVYDAKHPAPRIKRPVKIAIEAKLAFGTGTHETTQMALSQLLTIPIKGKRLLDCGCGTGILGIAAAKLGAEDVVCFDIDSWSVRNTRHNAGINGITNLYVMEGDASVLSHTSGLFDVVVANINRNTLIDDLPQYKNVLAPRGALILSGFYSDDIPLLLEHAASLGLKETARQEINSWCLLVLK